MRIPCRTPNTITPRLAVIESRKALRRTSQYRRSAPRSSSESAAAITTPASAAWGRSASRPFRKRRSSDDDAGADDAGELALGARLLGHGRARRTGRDGEALEEPGGDVGRPHRHHLLVGVDLVAASRREARGRGDGVGQAHEGDADRAEQERPDVAERGPRQRRSGDALGEHADGVDALGGETERR